MIRRTRYHRAIGAALLGLQARQFQRSFPVGVHGGAVGGVGAGLAADQRFQPQGVGGRRVENTSGLLNHRTMRI